MFLSMHDQSFKYTSYYIAYLSQLQPTILCVFLNSSPTFFLFVLCFVLFIYRFDDYYLHSEMREKLFSYYFWFTSMDGDFLSQVQYNVRIESTAEVWKREICANGYNLFSSIIYIICQTKTVLRQVCDRKCLSATNVFKSFISFSCSVCTKVLDRKSIDSRAKNFYHS